MVALGYIPSGSIKKALEFVRANSAHLKTNSISCYRELIEYYTTKECDPTMACQLYNEMMQKNWVLPRSGGTKRLSSTSRPSDALGVPQVDVASRFTI